MYVPSAVAVSFSANAITPSSETDGSLNLLFADTPGTSEAVNPVSCVLSDVFVIVNFAELTSLLFNVTDDDGVRTGAVKYALTVRGTETV